MQECHIQRISTQPPELLLFPLEERLISPIIPFMNVRECPVGGQKAIYGSICHVPVDVAPAVSSLPCNMQETDTISVKIKCKHSYKHHVLAENIRPRKYWRLCTIYYKIAQCSKMKIYR